MPRAYTKMEQLTSKVFMKKTADNLESVLSQRSFIEFLRYHEFALTASAIPSIY